jgi:hypothetical protein
MKRTGPTPSFSIPASSIHESYKLRALVIGFGSTVSFDGVEDKRSE